jgi:hypothetical protein
MYARTPMLKLILLFVALLMGMVFTMLPAGSSVIGFPFNESEIRLIDYLYFLMEHVVIIIFSFIIYSEAQTYRQPLKIFMVLMILDMIDFTMTFNNPWFYLEGFAVSMNTVSVMVFGAAIIHSYDNG